MAMRIRCYAFHRRHNQKRTGFMHGITIQGTKCGETISERRKIDITDQDGAMAVLRNQYKIRDFRWRTFSSTKIDKTLHG